MRDTGSRCRTDEGIPTRLLAGLRSGREGEATGTARPDDRFRRGAVVLRALTGRRSLGVSSAVTERSPRPRARYTVTVPTSLRDEGVSPPSKCSAMASRMASTASSRVSATENTGRSFLEFALLYAGFPLKRAPFAPVLDSLGEPLRAFLGPERDESRDRTAGGCGKGSSDRRAASEALPEGRGGASDSSRSA